MHPIAVKDMVDTTVFLELKTLKGKKFIMGYKIFVQILCMGWMVLKMGKCERYGVGNL